MTSLPEGWAEAPLGDIADVYQPETIAKSKLVPDGEYPVYGANGQIGRYDRYNHEGSELLITCRGATCGSVNVSEPMAWINGNAMVVRLDEGLAIQNFAEAFFRGEVDFSNVISGSAQPQITRQSLSPVVFPLPPLAEQKRIVEKLDRLSTRTRAAKDHLAKVQSLATRAKQATLAAAFRGELKADWRSEAPSSEWETKKASEACSIVQSGGTPKKDGFVEKNGIPFLKVYNIVNQQIAFGYRPQFISEQAHTKKGRKSIVLPGDVLMNIVGPPLGKVAIVTDEYPEWNCNQALTIFRPGPDVSTRWIFYFLCSGTSVASVTGKTRGVVGQVNISLSQCRGFEIPIAPLEEQTEIVCRIETTFARIDKMVEEASRAAGLLERLEQQLLAKAFRGELVAQDPNDEPASVLLERIREAREADKKTKPKRRRKSG